MRFAVIGWLSWNKLGWFLLGATCVVGVWGLLTILIAVKEVAGNSRADPR